MAAATEQNSRQNGKTYPVMSRDQIEGMIAEGKKIIIVDQYVLKVDPFLSYHPGGDKAIMHMVGRDATDEVTVLHSPEAREQMKRYRIGTVQGRFKSFIPPIQGGKFRASAEIDVHGEDTDSAQEPDSSTSSSSRAPSPVFDTQKDEIRQRKTGAKSDNEEAKPVDGMAFLDSLTREQISLDLDKYPSLDEETQDNIIKKYRELHQKIKDEGLYQCSYWKYGIESISYVSLFALMLVCIRYGWYITGAFSLGFMWHQLVFTAHDAGHMGITHDFHIDTVIGIIIADFIGGLSMGWWKRSHNIHHIVTNSPEHDPDIEHLPFFAISHRFLSNLTSTYYDRLMKYDAFAKVLLKVQAWTYFPILGLARLNLTFLSWDYLLAGRGPRKGPAAWHRWLELSGQVFFWAWYGYGIIYKSLPDNWTRFGFFMVSQIAASPLHVQIVLSHFAMSTADLGPKESFPQKMLRTTMDVDCPEWLDFLHGGLQFQVIHHLYPRVPRHNLRRTQKLVMEFCNEVGIPYALYGFVDGNKQVIGTLAEVSRQAAIFAKCHETITQTEGFHMH